MYPATHRRTSTKSCAILVDIRSDDERAGQVIDRMRGLLKRRALDTRRLNVGSLVGDVAALVRVDAAARQVKLNVDVPDDRRTSVATACISSRCCSISFSTAWTHSAARGRRFTGQRARAGRCRGCLRVDRRDWRGRRRPGHSAGTLVQISTRFSPPSRTAWAWVWRSPARLSNPTAGGSGQRTRSAAGQCFDSRCRLRKTRHRYDGERTRRSHRRRRCVLSGRVPRGCYGRAGSP